MNKQTRSELHHAMVELATSMLEILNDTEPGEIPVRKDADTVCWDLQNTAMLLRRSYENTE